MKSRRSRSIIRGALLILAVAASGCVGEVDDPPVAEALGAASVAADRAPAADVVAGWAREDAMTAGSLRELLSDLAERAAAGGEVDGSSAVERARAGWREEPLDAPE